MEVRFFHCPMPSIPPMLGVLAAVAGALAAWTGVFVTVLMFLWNKLDKRFDDLEARQNQRFDDLEARQDKRFDELKDGLTKLEARQEAMRAEQREDNKALSEKLDRLLESRLSTPL